jgi:hypothetical protein
LCAYLCACFCKLLMFQFFMIVSSPSAAAFFDHGEEQTSAGGALSLAVAPSLKLPKFSICGLTFQFAGGT